MTALSRNFPQSAPSHPCRSDCSGYGTRSSCPPLIVLAMQAEHGADGPGAVLSRFAGKVVSGRFCGCIFSGCEGFRTAGSGQRSEM
jgi:hypothetical protein